jgi:SHS2 domain-containing protein
MLFSNADVTIDERDGRWRLAATAAGEPFDAARHPSRVQVKGATYHGLEVVQEHGTWKARVVFDI